ncbi:glycosyltransferase family 2 protein [Litoribacter ruber]|uniref:glycosyltransferase family 2 protein n=1 Tax=Litoribacter ruber TaxID=702568 RepID=UPI001BDAAD1F|nr:glycosyltransferase family A protein [Litoribacter ruber]MBT0812297.1 glycosyltransferase family 2 protein [Litoribacter ruber]
MKNLISIIIPFYNAEKYLAATIQSCLDQTYPVIEVILVNDGSNDKSENVINSFDDNRLKYFSLPNGGPCRARNFGLSKATGELIQFLDADDILEKHKLSIQFKKFLQYGDDYIFSGIMGNIIGHQKTLEQDFNFYYKNLSVLEYFQEMFRNFGKYYTTGVWLVPRKLVDKTHRWDEKVLLNNDGEYFCRVILASKGVVFCPGATFYYRRDVPMSVSKQLKSKRINESWLYSYTCYTRHFQLTFDKKTANNLSRKALSVFYCNSYPNHPDLLNECKKQIKELGFNSPSAHGSKVFKIISAIIGVDNALKFRTYKDRAKYLTKPSV